MESPPCPRCGCPTLTMLVRAVTLTSGQVVQEYSCDACGQGFRLSDEHLTRRSLPLGSQRSS